MLDRPEAGALGGGLFTTDGYVAGVCDFAEPRGNHGLYASPRSIHHLLDRNNLTALYAPAGRQDGTLLAGKDAARRGTPAQPATIARAQSPDRDEANKEITIPPPEMLGIKPVADPAVAGRAGSPRARPLAARPATGLAAGRARGRRRPLLGAAARPRTGRRARAEAPKPRPSGGRWRPVRSATAEPSPN